MHDSESIDHIRRRASRAGLTFVELVRRAGLDYSTFSRISSGARGGHMASYLKLGKALSEYEIELRDYLIGLHGLPAENCSRPEQFPAPGVSEAAA